MKREITLKLIDKYGPCTSGRDNLLKHYPNVNFTVQEFLTLENIPYDDKIWLMCKILPIKVLQYWSLACASSQLENISDVRVKECLLEIEKFLQGKSNIKNLNEAMLAAWSAAKSAESAAKSAESAAKSAESAAWSAAWSAQSAAWSSARSVQEEINIILLLDCINEVK